MFSYRREASSVASPLDLYVAMRKPAKVFPTITNQVMKMYVLYYKFSNGSIVVLPSGQGMPCCVNYKSAELTKRAHTPLLFPALSCSL